MKFKGNEPLLLTDPETVWVVKSGVMAVFAVPLKDGIAEGSRRYLFSVQPSEALFGIKILSDEKQQGLLAVALEETELDKISLQQVKTNLISSTENGGVSKAKTAESAEVSTTANVSPLIKRFSRSPSTIQTEPEEEKLSSLFTDSTFPLSIASVEAWIHKLSRALTPFSALAAGVQATGNRILSLTDGQTLQPATGNVSWVRVQQGTAQWMGFPEITLDKNKGILPLGNGSMLVANGTIEVATITTAEISNLDTLQAGLELLHINFLQGLEKLGEKELEAEFNRFHDRQRLNRQMTQEAMGELVSVLKPQEEALIPEGDRLLIAAGAVGKSLGIKIRPPARSENLAKLKEPLEAIVRASRIRMRRVLLTNQWWLTDSGALIAYTREENNPVALLPKAGRYELFDPQTRNSIPVNVEVANTLAPVAYTFYRSLPDKVLKAIDVLKFVLRGRLKDLAVILLTGVAATLMGMITPQATGILIDQAIPNADRGLLGQIGLGLLAAAFGATAFQLAQVFTLMRIETGTDSTTQPAVWDRLLNLRLSFFRQYSIGDLESRVSAITEIRRKLSGTTLRTITTSFFSLLNLGLLFYYSSQLALIALAVALLVLIFTSVSGIFMVRQTNLQLEMQGDIFGLMVQLINGISKLRVAGAEERAFAFWGKKFSQQQKVIRESQRIEDIVNVFNSVMPTLTSVILFWLAVYLLQQAQSKGSVGLSTGTFLAFNAAFATFIGGATELSNTITDVLQVVTQWKRVKPILEATPEVDLTKADPGRLSGDLFVDHVTFRYRNDGPLILEDVSIKAAPGEFIAFVGPSGSGKSTIFRLLLGFDLPESGTIYFDGQDLSGLDVYAVRRQLGVVLQNGRITSASIFENISSGANVSMDEAWEAARMAGFAEDVEQMPMGMHTVISEGGTNLSGGQRQRLLIARSLVLKPRILLFDEATSALDNRTQAIVSESLDKLRVTRVVIAHRLSTIRNADRIYVLAAGRVVQQGSFNDLANQEGLFKKLIARQMA